MSLTANFDYCVQLALGPVKAIFHLALKNEEFFPHNIAVPNVPIGSGMTVNVAVRLLDDNDSPADLAFDDAKHIRFTLPIELSVEIPDAPDPSLSQVTLRSAVAVPGALATWPVDGQDQLGIDFADVTPADVDVPVVSGLPNLDAGRFETAIHERYVAMPSHTFTHLGNTLVLYDGTRDLTLTPSNKPGNPEITAAITVHGGTSYLEVRLPIHATVPSAGFASYGVVTFWREIVQDDVSVSVVMGTEPADPALETQIAFDTSHPATSVIITNLRPLIIARLGDFGTIQEPWFTEASAKLLIAQQTAAYLAPRRFPVFTPDSGDPAHPLSTPVGFLLPAEGVLAVLMNRRDSSVADFAPDAFIGSNQIALAVGRAKLDETIQAAMNEQFPGVNNGGAAVSTDEGDATLEKLSVTPSDPGTHGEAEGHLWVEGEAEVHIDCWPDPDVSFDGPIFLRVVVHEDDETCELTIQPEMGDFDAGQSCCDVLIDLIIPIVGIIMLIVIENMIDEVGGELAAEFASAHAQNVQAIPPFVAGVAELQACLEGLETSSRGLVFPGKLRIRREGRSFEDLAESGNLPRP